jgi:hypothetical protein
MRTSSRAMIRVSAALLLERDLDLVRIRALVLDSRTRRLWMWRSSSRVFLRMSWLHLRSWGLLVWLRRGSASGEIHLDSGVRAPDYGFDGLHGGFGWFGDMGIVVVWGRDSSEIRTVIGSRIVG